MLKVSILFSLALLAGCAPGLGTELRVNAIPELSSIQTVQNMTMSRVALQRFNDSRQKPVIGEVDGRELAAGGDVADSVRRALELRLKAHGAQVVLFNAPSISGDVREWFVKVNPGFPSSKVEAKALIKLRVFSQRDKALYEGSYKGEMSEESPVFSEGHIEQVLGGAMSQALNEALSDPELLRSLGG